MTKIKDIINHLEQIAPPAYQESYDNTGLVVGDMRAMVTGILICLDVTEAVLKEAQAQNCNLIIAHHPIIFQPIKKLTPSSSIEKCIIQAIQQDLAIYIMHTNLDNIAQGVNKRLSQCLDLQELTILLPKRGTLSKLTTFVPQSAIQEVLQALYLAGAGHIGNYTHCSFVSTGTGSFKPTPAAHPYIGNHDQVQKLTEHRAEVVFPNHLTPSIIASLKQAHPYEEVAYYIQKLENEHAEVGAGMIGVLSTALSSESFLGHLKNNMQLGCIRHSLPITRPIRKVAVCGGSGSFLLQAALRQQADAFVTADMKYHDFLNAEGHILAVDIGHYESEIITKNLIYDLLAETFVGIFLLKCKTITNPVYYYP